MIRLVVLVAALSCGACAPALMKLPAGPGAPAADAAEALRDATKACRAVTTISAEIGVSGSVGGRGVRTRLLAGLAAPDAARLEAVAPFGPPIFFFVARDGDATVLLPRDRRVLEHGRPAEVLAAVSGVPLNAADLRIALTGCVVAPRAGEARAAGDDWRIVPDGMGEVYLHRETKAAPWRLVAVVRRTPGETPWRAEYRDFQAGAPTEGLPKLVRLTSVDARRFDVRLALSQVEVNTPLGAEVFSIPIPRGTEAITLEELKQSGPLAASANGT